MASSSLHPRIRLTGTRLGRYWLGPELGTGAAATVYLAKKSEPNGANRIVALKVIHSHAVDQQEFEDLFLDEAKLAVRLSHPNVVHVYELGRDPQGLFLAMEYLHGETLATVCHRLMGTEQRLPCDVIAWLGARAADGLHYAHELTDAAGTRLALVHRDVSPQNLFVGYDGQLTVIDFGIARTLGRVAQTAKGKIRGKFRYMAPEQLLGTEFDHRVDVFALGATLYELAVNAALFDAADLPDMLSQILEGEIPDPRLRRPNIPSEMVRVLRKALALQPDDRYATASELARDLDCIVASFGRSDQKAQLAASMSLWFAEEMQTRASEVAALRATAPSCTERPHPPAATTPESYRRWLTIVAIGSVICAVLVAALWTIRH